MVKSPSMVVVKKETVKISLQFHLFWGLVKSQLQDSNLFLDREDCGSRYLVLHSAPQPYRCRNNCPLQQSNYVCRPWICLLELVALQTFQGEEAHLICAKTKNNATTGGISEVVTRSIAEAHDGREKFPSHSGILWILTNLFIFTDLLNTFISPFNILHCIIKIHFKTRTWQQEHNQISSLIRLSPFVVPRPR